MVAICCFLMILLLTETVPYMPTKTFRAIRDNNPKGIYMQKK